MSDNINPDHYAKSCSIECIQAMRLVLGKEGIYYFCLGNAMKYMWRYKNKNGEEDIRKAGWYLDYVAKNILEQKDDFPNYIEEIFVNLSELYSEIKSEIIQNEK